MSMLSTPTTVVAALRRPRHVFYTGAGMGAAAGIPTFRGISGLWVFPRELQWALAVAMMTGTVFLLAVGLPWWYVALMVATAGLCGCVLFVGGMHRHCISASIWRTRVRPMMWVLYNLFLYRHLVRAEPTMGHLYMHKLQAGGKDVYVVTQNIDNLALCAGVRPDHVHQLHGTAGTLLCTKCRRHRRIEGGDFALPPLGHPWAWACTNPKCGSRRHMRPGPLLFGDGSWRPAKDGGGRMPSGRVSALFNATSMWTSDGAAPPDFAPELLTVWIIGTSNKIMTPVVSYLRRSRVGATTSTSTSQSDRRKCSEN